MLLLLMANEVALPTLLWLCAAKGTRAESEGHSMQSMFCTSEPRSLSAHPPALEDSEFLAAFYATRRSLMLLLLMANEVALPTLLWLCAAKGTRAESEGHNMFISTFGAGGV